MTQVLFIIGMSLAVICANCVNGIEGGNSSIAKVHVVLCVDSSQADAALTLITSILRACNKTGQFHFHIVTGIAHISNLRPKIRCLARTRPGLFWSLYSLESYVDLSNTPFRVHDTKKKNLGNPLNFARFYLDRILRWQELNFSKVLYIDTDCVVQACISPLYHETLLSTTAPVAAAWRRNSLSKFVKFSHPVWATLNSSMRGKLSGQTVAFNAGVLVIDLGRWRKMNVLGRVLFWAETNKVTPLYKLGSNPPLVLALAGEVEYFSHLWNFEGFGSFKWVSLADLCNARIIHWSGQNKPWMPLTWLDKWFQGKLYAKKVWEENCLAHC